MSASYPRTENRTPTSWDASKEEEGRLLHLAGVQLKVDANNEMGEYGQLAKYLRSNNIDKSAHHIIQDVTVRHLPGYDRNKAPAVALHARKPYIPHTQHHAATSIQRASLDRGTYGKERKVGENALRAARISVKEISLLMGYKEGYFSGIGVNDETKTNIPKNLIKSPTHTKLPKKQKL